MTMTVADFLADNAPPVEHDQYGRYLLPDPNKPDDGKVPWTRATTWAESVRDNFGLTRWQMRMLARGLVMRGDLIVRLASEFEDNDVADAVIADAQEHAGARARATIGTAMHRFTELLDSGEQPIVVPESVAADLKAYRDVIARSGLTPVAIERIVCVPELGVAGTLDRIFTLGPCAWIGDLKTGEQLWLDTIAIQLALYSHASFMWNGQAWEPMHPVERDEGIVMWLPYGEGRCELWAVDLAAGWEAATELCGRVRSWRKRDDLAHPWLPPADAIPEPAPDDEPEQPESDEGEPEPEPAPSDNGQDKGASSRAEWITGRLQALAADERARNLVALGWPDGVEVRPPWTHDDMMALAALLDDVEAKVQAGWPAPDPQAPASASSAVEPAPASPPERCPPWTIEDDGQVATADDLAALGATLSFANEAQQATLQRWQREAMREHRDFASPPLTRRMWCCARAAIACAFHLTDDDRTRRALTGVIGGYGEGWSIGATIGSLSLDQAERLADAADAYAAGTRPDLDPV